MKKFSQLAVPYIVWAALMLVMPMFLIAMYSVTEQGNSIVSFKFTLDHYVRFFTDPDFLLILWRSIVIAVKTTVICLLLGYPIAYYIARSEQKKQNAIRLRFLSPAAASVSRISWCLALRFPCGSICWCVPMPGLAF